MFHYVMISNVPKVITMYSPNFFVSFSSPSSIYKHTRILSVRFGSIASFQCRHYRHPLHLHKMHELGAKQQRQQQTFNLKWKRKNELSKWAIQFLLTQNPCAFNANNKSRNMRMNNDQNKLCVSQYRFPSLNAHSIEIAAPYIVLF